MIDLHDQLTRSVSIVKERVKTDVKFFGVTVAIEPRKWREWLATQFEERRFKALAQQTRSAGAPLSALARLLAFEILYRGLNGYEYPLLAIPYCLPKREENSYWRAIAIARYSRKEW